MSQKQQQQPIRKPAFADSKVADAARRTGRAKREGEGLVRKGSQITRRKGADNYTLRVIDPTPKKQKTPAEKTFEKTFENRGGFLKKLRAPGSCTPSYNVRPRGGASSHGPVFGERSAMQSYEYRSVRSWSKEFNWTLTEGRK